MVGRRKHAQMLAGLQKETAALEKSNKTNSTKIAQWTSAYLDDQGRQSTMESEPAQLEAEISNIDEPLATAETISFQLEREKKKVGAKLDTEDSKLRKLGGDRISLDSDGLDSLLSSFFRKIDFKSDTQSLTEPVTTEENTLEANLSSILAEKSARLSVARSTAGTLDGLPVPLKRMLLKQMKVGIKSTNTELINTKLYLRRVKY